MDKLREIGGIDGNFLGLALVLCLFLAVVRAFGAEIANVTGKWDLTIKSPRGEQTRLAQFRQDGEELTVIMQGRDGQEIESKGTVKGAAIEWSSTRETPRGKLTITSNGTIEGDSMKGAVEFGTFGSGDWSAMKAGGE